MSKRNTNNSAINTKLRTSFVITIVSISLVLFLLGLEGLIILNANKLSEYVKENLGFTVFLKDDVKEVEMLRLQKYLDAIPEVKSTLFISKDEAAEILIKDLGEDFVSFLGYNPLAASIDVKFHAADATPVTFSKIEKELLGFPQVKEVNYKESLIHLVNEKIYQISIILLVFSLVLFSISIVLINNTIRLMVYSKRFLIKTMKLVGATNNFIRTPFVLKGALNGLLSALVSIVFLTICIYFLRNYLKDFAGNIDIELLGILFLSVILIGMFITSITTFFAVSKYLKLKSDRLYL
ncbi:MAG: FtsX-like permease family protein [Bacteroidales bacterium]|nr:FtsX-like permease family protein [Bacteroidales bacterium]